MSLDPTHIPDQPPYDSDAVNRARNLLEAIPENIGPYRILERIGTGGMGEVYRAEQRTPIRREVALKLIKLGMDTKLVIARFEAERQALALMDHPHIAKVFDANADDTGRPYFVMEYVKGKPITEYADHQRLSIPERLELFQQVCQAVQHAHHKGVIHRDLKPSNVLVCTQDGKPFSKVIDFGVAKAIVQRLTEKTFFTEHGQFVGTPHYMSPEQAEGSIDIDTRTDVYSLGVLLYELLTGSTPFAGDELRKAAFEQLKRMVIEVDPPKPSTRLQSNVPRHSVAGPPPKVPLHSVAGSPPNSPPNSVEPENPPRSVGPHSTPLETLARHRSTEPKRLSILVRGELDWIVMKALEKDRKRRYETPTNLAADIRSHLTGGTVLAAPPSLWYRTQKFARKYRYALIGTGTAFALLLLAVLGTTYGLRRARIAEEIARTSEGQAVAARDEAMQERDAKEAQRKLAEAATLAEAKQRELAERQLIDGLLRPIGYGDEPTTAELRSFVDWSQIPDGHLKLRVLEVAFDNPEVALRLARRSERAMQACIGLSPTRRAKAIEIVTAKQRDMQADPRIRTAAAWLALELGSTELSALPEALTWLSDPTAADQVRPEFADFIHCMTTRVESLSPDQITLHGNALISVLEKAEHVAAHQAAGNSLVAFAPKLSPEQITRGWDALIVVLKESFSSDARQAAGNGLVALAPKLSPEEITRGWDALIAVLVQPNESDARQAAGNALVALVQKLNPTQITRGWDALIYVLGKTEGRDASLQAAGSGLVALAPKLSPEQSARGGDTLIAVLEKSKPNWAALQAAGSGLVALAPNLSPEQSTRGWDALIAVLEKTEAWDARHATENGLIALAPMLSPEQITRGGDALIAVLEKSTDDQALQAAGNGLVALALRLSPEQITQGWDALIAVLQKSTHDRALQAAGNGLAALGPKLRPEQVTCGWDALIAVLEKTTHYNALQAAGNGLAALAPRLTPEQITRGWDAITAVLEKTEDSGAQIAAGKGLVALAPKLNTEQITRGGDALIAVLENATEIYARQAAGKGLVSLAPKLSPNQRVKAAELMVASLIHFKGGWLTEQLLALMPHLERPTQNRISAEELNILLDRLFMSQDYFNPSGDGLDMEPFRIGVMAVTDARSCFAFLQHPACFGEPREWILQRFEELVFHDGNRVFLNLPEADGEWQGSDENSPSAIPPAGANGHGGLTPNRSPAEPPPRRFHTVHDAAAWIQQNWPDFDLEATHPVTWRGER